MFKKTSYFDFFFSPSPLKNLDFKKKKKTNAKNRY